MMHNPINKLIMQEIGLGINSQHIVIDQDTREVLKFKDKTLKYSSTEELPISKTDIEFDPTDTRNLMGSLFDHYANKINGEGDVYISLHYDVPGENGTALEAVIDTKPVRSGYYKSDYLRYLDLIMQINGSSPDNLKQYDQDIKSGKRKRG